MGLRRPFPWKRREVVVGKRREEWLDQAREHHRAGRLDAAASCYQRVLRIEPMHVDALIGLADVLESLGRNGEAILLLEGAMKRSPLCVLQARLADAFHAQGDLTARSRLMARPSSRSRPWLGRGGAWGAPRLAR